MSVPVDPSRVYVGNVDYSATEDELQEFLQEFKVLSVEVPSKTITRGETTYQKRLGFGFAQFENEADAQNAISQVSGKKFKRRQLYATKALPPATEEEKEKRKELALAKREEAKAKKREAIKQAAPSKSSDEKMSTGSGGTGTICEKTTSNANKTPEGVRSTTTIFITNLDYKANTKRLTELFKDLEPIWINVPTRRVPFHILRKFTASKKPIFNKGIAFVKFADEATQLRAIKEFNGTEINGRKIVVEVAVDKPVPNKTSSSEPLASPDDVSARPSGLNKADSDESSGSGDVGDAGVSRELKESVDPNDAAPVSTGD